MKCLLKYFFVILGLGFLGNYANAESSQMIKTNDVAIEINPKLGLNESRFKKKIIFKSLLKKADKSFKEKKIIRGCSQLRQLQIVFSGAVLINKKDVKKYYELDRKYNCSLFKLKESTQIAEATSQTQKVDANSSIYKFCSNGTISLSCYKNETNLKLFLYNKLSGNNDSDSDLSLSEDQIFERELNRVLNEFKVYNLDTNLIFNTISEIKKFDKFQKIINKNLTQVAKAETNQKEKLSNNKETVYGSGMSFSTIPKKSSNQTKSQLKKKLCNNSKRMAIEDALSNAKTITKNRNKNVTILEERITKSEGNFRSIKCYVDVKVDLIDGAKKVTVAKKEEPKKKIVKVKSNSKQKKIISYCKLKNNYRIIKKEKCIGSFKKISQENYIIGYLTLSGDNLKKSQNQLKRLKKQFKSNNIDLAFIDKTIKKNSNLRIYANLPSLQKSKNKKNKIIKKTVKNKNIKKKTKKLTKIENSKKLIQKKFEIKKSTNLKKETSSWEKSVIVAKKNEKDYQCELDVDRELIKPGKDKVKIMDLKKIFKKKEYCIKKSDILMLGKFKKINYPKNFLDKQIGCKTDNCLRAKAGKKVQLFFLKRGPKYHAKYPGAMIEGMVWFELLYLQKLKTNEKRIKRYLNDNYDIPLGDILKSDDPRKLYSLIKMNKGRIKMREALGFSLYDSTDEVIEQQFLLSEFLNKDKLKVVKNEISPNLQKRKELIERYKSVLTRYKEKLEEKKRNKENENKKS